MLYVQANDNALSGVEFGVLIALAVAIVLAWALAPWDRLPRAAQVLLPLGAVAMAVLMQVFALPNNRDLMALMIVPVLWSAAFGTAREAITVTGIAIAAVVTLHALGLALGNGIGMTGWPEVIALSGGLALLGLYTVTARAHARTDPLTGTANRRAWNEILAQEISRARRHPVPVAVGIIDLDEFKRFNDVHGHAAGDLHLAACASAWERCLRAHDVLARLGGEEFAVLLVGADSGAEQVVRRLIEAVPGGESCSVARPRLVAAAA